jgi:parallel beta-helix repeat protein
MHRAYTALSFSAAALVLVAGSLVVAGPLGPAGGPVASTYKTLAEVEPRVAINAANTPGDAISIFKITQPGSYYLTGNLAGQAGKDAVIFIAADGVTLDLNGFTINCSSSQFGLSAGSIKHATIRNGVIRNAGTNAISLSNATATQVADVQVFSSGESAIGLGASSIVERVTCINSGTGAIYVGAGSTVTQTTVSGSGDYGISATKSVIDDCAVTGAGGYGFSIGESSTITNSTATGCVSGFGATSKSRFVNCIATLCTSGGFTSGFTGVIEGCTAISNGTDGILANDDAVIRNCTSSDNIGHGINADNRAVIVGNSANKNGAAIAGTTSAGVYVAGTDCRVEGNSVMGNDWGIRVNGAGNFIVRNTASGNTTINYSTLTNNFWGPVASAAASAANSGNSGFGGLGNTDPNANFSY